VQAAAEVTKPKIDDPLVREALELLKKAEQEGEIFK